LNNRTASIKNRFCNSTTMSQVSIGGVHNRVQCFLGYVTLAYFKLLIILEKVSFDYVTHIGTSFMPETILPHPELQKNRMAEKNHPVYRQ
jgi:hypothetical protein